MELFSRHEFMMTKGKVPAVDDLVHYPAWLEVVKAYEKCHRLMSVRLAEVGLSVAQHEVLLALGREGGLTQVELAARLLSAKSNVTALLKKLEASELVVRRGDPKDRRSYRVFLTPSGRRRLRKSSAIHANIVDLMTEGFSLQAAETVRGAMRDANRKLTAALRQS